jgi:hypothetical protein
MVSVQVMGKCPMPLVCCTCGPPQTSIEQSLLWVCQMYVLTFPYYVIGILAFRLH